MNLQASPPDCRIVAHTCCVCDSWPAVPSRDGGIFFAFSLGALRGCGSRITATAGELFSAFPTKLRRGDGPHLIKKSVVTLMANLSGWFFRDYLYGTDNSDCILDFGGDDVIHAFGGNDVIDAGSGNDRHPRRHRRRLDDGRLRF